MKRFLSLCSGIEAASVAWEPLGWKAAAFSEIDAFPCAVLAHRFPDVPSLGDMTRFQEWPLEPVDIVCGGTPCQAFSVAGLRKGLADPRGNLALTFLAIVDRYRPRWVVWENVPGVLSSDGGRDFAAFLGGLGLLGYGWAYRVLDAQWCRVDGFPRAVPQRRRRVFVVGYLGDWRRSAAVLFEPESVLGDHPPRREAGEGFTRGADGGAHGSSGLVTPDWPAEVAPTLDTTFGDKMGLENQHINGGAGLFVAHTLKGEGFDASEDGTGRGTPIVPVAFDWYASQSQSLPVDTICPPLKTTMQPAVAFQTRGSNLDIGVIAGTIGSNADRASGGAPMAQMGHAVRRLTPRECERLQGFPDDWTLIPYRGKPATDGPRYKAIGNSWAVNVARWVGRRIEMVEQISQEAA